MVTEGTRSLGPPGVIRLGSTIKDVDCDQGQIIFSDGTVTEKDLVIVADGVRVRLNTRFRNSYASANFPVVSFHSQDHRSTSLDLLKPHVSLPSLDSIL